MKGSVHEDIFYSARCVETQDREDNDNMDAKNKCLHRWFLPFSVLQYWAPCDVFPVVNSPRIMRLDNSLNRDILQSLRFHSVLSRIFLRQRKRWGRKK